MGKLLSLLIAIGYLVCAIIGQHGLTLDVLKCFIVLLFPLALIWFPEQIGEATGYFAGHMMRVDTPTLAILISIMGCWIETLACLMLFFLGQYGQAQDFTYATNNGAIIITGYTGPGGNVTIPDSLNGLPVTAIGDAVFKQKFSVTSVTIPGTVTSIGNWAFAYTSVTNVVVPGSVTNLGDYVMYSCYGLLSVVIPGTVRNIGSFAFSDCTHLGNTTLLDGVSSIGTNAFADDNFGSMVIPASVTNLSFEAFAGCYNLSSLYFKGDAPYADPYAFYSSPGPLRAYYLPGANGWGPTLGVHPAVPTAIWTPLRMLTAEGGSGLPNNRFGFTVIGSTNDVVVVEACSNLANPIWSYFSMLTLSGGASPFSDPTWTNYMGRFYRVRSR